MIHIMKISHYKYAKIAIINVNIFKNKGRLHNNFT